MTFLDRIILFFYDPVVKAQYDNNQVMTLTLKSGKEEKYHGACTVWSYFPDMYDVGLMEESRLHRFWKLCMYSIDRTWIKKHENI